MLNRDEWLHLAPSHTGSVRVNHDSPMCSGNSKSMKIERKHDGTLLAHCYRCGESGSVRQALARYKSSQAGPHAASASAPATPSSLPRDGSGTLREWPGAARVWLTRYGITQAEVTLHSLVYSPSWQRVCLPVFDDDDKLLSYQARRVFSHDPRPKYLSVGGYNNKLIVNNKSNTIVIVEDIVSAIKCSRFVNAVALNGTMLSPVTIERIKSNQCYLVFMDDDNRQVKMKQLSIKSRLDMYGNTKIIRGIGRDPKELSTLELEEILV